MDLTVSETYAALNFALKTHNLGFSIAANEMEETSRGSPDFRRLIGGILYSRRFILSYQVVLLVFILVFTAIHWGSRLRSSRKRYAVRRGVGGTSRKLSSNHQDVADDLDDAGSGASSSSSTLQQAFLSSKALSGDGQKDEQSPLLVKSKPSMSSVQRPSAVQRIRAWLVYQPHPIPLINKTMPPNNITLAVLALIGLQIFYMLWNVPFSMPMLFIFADRVSLVFVANLPLLYVFAAKNQPIKFLTGYSYESLNIFHRRLGEIMCLLALVHSAGMIVVWYTILRPTGFTLAHFLLSKIILLGIGAFVAYELLYVTSLGSFRQRWYELFLGMHIVLQVIALVFVWFHHSGSRPYVGVALAIFIVDRFVFRMFLKSRIATASLQVKDDDETVVLRTKLPLQEKGRTLRYLFSSSVTSGWKATEHVFLNFPSLSQKYIIQAHPFTIASKSPINGNTESTLKLVIRAQDGFSGDLLKYARSHGTAAVRLDGPYGSQSAIRMLQDSDISVIVAGGSGVAVAWPLVWALLDSPLVNDLEYFSALSRVKRILFIWIVHSKSHLTWLDPRKLKDLQTKGVDVVLPPPTSERGHPDIDSIMKDWLAGLESSEDRAPSKLGVVCSGPDGMNRSVRNLCSSLLREGRDVSVEIEKFGW